MTQAASPVRRFVIFATYTIAAVLVLFFTIEGFASFLYAVHGAFAQQPLAERLHTEYDPDLGWVNLPNVELRNMYGPGKNLRTNSQRFRNNADFSTAVPPGKTRIICSGDSYTLGYGVDNDNTWPQLLASRAGNIETVNMGQGGYGADQAYLWYKRDGVKLDHDIQIFAALSYDFPRMQQELFSGYGKPVLAIEHDHLVTRNVPVPNYEWAPTLVRAQNAASQLSSVQLLRRILGLQRASPAADADTQSNEETLRVLSLIFDDLAELNRAKHSVLVLAYLPRRDEYDGDMPEPWRKFLAEYGQSHGILYLDFVDDLRRLDLVELNKLFIAKGVVDFPGAAGHYTEAGNAFIADLIYRRLLANPETALKLGNKTSASGRTSGSPPAPAR
jgi:hypothetical protein